MGLITVPSELCILEYLKGTDWKTIPGISSYRESGGEPPERDDVAFEGASKRTGHPRVPSVECPAFFQPLQQAWQDMYQYAIDRTVVNFRLRTPEENVYPGTSLQAAIADTGVVTISGSGTAPDLTEAHFGPGLSFKFDAAQLGTKYWHIESISASGVATVSPAPASSIAAADLDSDGGIVLAGTRRGANGFPASVRIAGLMDLSAEASAQTTLSLSPRGALPAWVADE